MGELLSNPDEYWNQRHQSVNEWQSGGDRSLSLHRNRAFYAHRLGLITTILDTHTYGQDLRILDAGCGKGWLSHQLSELGHVVCGIDQSETAIQICRDNRQGAYHRSAIDTFGARLGFDVVVVMDVLFHVLDDELWKSCIRNLSSLCRGFGVLVFSEHLTDGRYELGDYIVHRSREEYITALGDCGMHIEDEIPYGFGGNPNSFFVAKRSY